MLSQHGDSKTMTDNTETLESNYEKDCPPLYAAIEGAESPEDYARIVKFLSTGRWEGSYFNIGASPAVQAKTWVTRFDEQDNTKVKWSQLPLHLAVVCDAPFALIKALVELYPAALRCTDDQHMLPLHLSLRHGLPDETVAFFVEEFPEAVNAKGKSGRTSVECASRAKPNHRGKILKAFVDRTKGRISKTVVAERASLKSALEIKRNELATLNSELDAQYSVIDKLRGELAKAKSDMEAHKSDWSSSKQDLVLKIQSLQQAKEEALADASAKAQRNDSDKLVESMELQKKLEELRKEKKMMKETQAKMIDTEMKLRQQLESVQAKVNKSVSNEDWNSLKKEISNLRQERFVVAREEAKHEIAELKDDLVRATNKSRGDFSSMQKAVTMLADQEQSAKTEAQINTLRGELKVLRADMKARQDEAETKAELADLKVAMETELRNSEGKTKEELDAVKKVLKKADPKRIQSKTHEELAKVKAEMEALKLELTEKELFAKTKKDIEDLCTNLETSLETLEAGKFKKEATAVKKTADALYTRVKSISSKDDMIVAKKEIEDLRDSWKAKEISARIHEEASVLKTNIDDEIKKSQGKTQQELVQIRKALKSLTDEANDNKKAEELLSVRNELFNVREELKGIEKATNTQVEMTVLKKALEFQLQETNSKAQQDLQEMKKAVDAIDMEHKESKKLKKSLGEEIKHATVKAEQELIAMKKALESINIAQIESKNQEEWEAVRTELTSLKTELETKRTAEMSNTEKELAAMKKVVEAINVKELEQKTTSDFQEIRKEMDSLKSEIKEKADTEVALKKALEDLKEQAQQRSLAFKKDKAGIKKFLSRRFSRSKLNSGRSNASSVGFNYSMSFDSNADDHPIEVGGSTPILPPSLSNDAMDAAMEAADDNASHASEQRALEMNPAKEEPITSAANPSPPKPGMPPLPPKKAKSNFLAAQTKDAPPPPVMMSRTRSKISCDEDGTVELEAVQSPVAASS